MTLGAGNDATLMPDHRNRASAGSSDIVTDDLRDAADCPSTTAPGQISSVGEQVSFAR